MIGYFYDENLSPKEKEWGQTIETMSNWYNDANWYKEKYETLVKDHEKLSDDYTELSKEYNEMAEELAKEILNKILIQLGNREWNQLHALKELLFQ